MESTEVKCKMTNQGSECESPRSCAIAGSCLYRSSADQLREARRIVNPHGLTVANDTVPVNGVIFDMPVVKDESCGMCQSPGCKYCYPVAEFCEVAENNRQIEMFDRGETFVNHKQVHAKPGSQITWTGKPDPVVRTFASGANRDQDDTKLDYEGFLSPLVLEAFAEYMNKNRYLRDGTRRDSDNWQKGIPRDVYMKSMWRHFFAVWKSHRAGSVSKEDLTALLFNVQGMLHELLVGR